MSSILLSVFTRFTQRAAATPVNPSSWAVVCLWKRFFALKDEEQEQQLVLIHQMLDDVQHEISPITMDSVIEARANMVQEAYLPRQRIYSNMVVVEQPMARIARSSLQALVQSRQVEQLERVASNQANLNIPQENGDYMYYAQ